MSARKSLAIALLSVAASANADLIREWRTPAGQLYFGDRPPAGSALLATIADGPPSAGGGDDALARAAADGREIMRRRAAAREAERAVPAPVERGRAAPLDVEAPGIVVFEIPRLFHHHHRHRHHDALPPPITPARPASAWPGSPPAIIGVPDSPGPTGACSAGDSASPSRFASAAGHAAARRAFTIR